MSVHESMDVPVFTSRFSRFVMAPSCFSVARHPARNEHTLHSSTLNAKPFGCGAAPAALTLPAFQVLCIHAECLAMRRLRALTHTHLRANCNTATY